MLVFLKLCMHVIKQVILQNFEFANTVKKLKSKSKQIIEYQQQYESTRTLWSLAALRPACRMKFNAFI